MNPSAPPSRVTVTVSVRAPRSPAGPITTSGSRVAWSTTIFPSPSIGRASSIAPARIGPARCASMFRCEAERQRSASIM